MSGVSRRELAIAGAIGLASLAALVPMSEIFVEAAWIRPAVTSALVALALAVGARALGTGAATSLTVTIVGYLVVQSALHLPDASPVPLLDELRGLRELVRAGLVHVRDEAAPTTALPGLVLLVSTGAWAVTFVGHELAVRLRSTGLALVPLASLWVVPLAVPQTVPPGRLIAVPFLAAAAIVLLVDADADLAGWARDRVGPRISGVGIGIGAGAIALGLVAPWLLPGLGEPAVLAVGTGRNPTGYQPLVDIGDRLTLPIDRAVLRVRSDRRNYLRLAALETYDDETWRIGPAGEDSFTPADAELFPADEPPLRFEEPIAEAVTTVVDVEVLDLENIYVPTPYQPVEVSGPGARDMIWSTVGGFLATGELSENELGGRLRYGVVPGFEYSVVASVPDPDPDALRDVQYDREQIAPLLQLPGRSDQWDKYAQEAARIWDRAGATDPLERVDALQDWFTDGDFEYSVTDVDRLQGSTALEEFVFGSKVGYCEYFSTAMAVMLRASGIPARVAVGFLPGEVVAVAPPDAQDQRTTYQVSTSDAHAWVEVLFPGHGWITFDPTPRSDGATIPPDVDDLAPQVPLAERTEEDDAPTDSGSGGTSSPDQSGADPAIPDLEDPAAQPGGGGGDGGGTGDEGSGAWVVVVVTALLAGAATLLLARRGRRPRGDAARGRHAAIAAQRRVLLEAERLGGPRSEAETAAEALHRWASEGRVDPSRAAELAALGQRAAFARSTVVVDGRRATVLADELVEEMRASATRSTRWLSPVRVPVTRGVATARRVVEEGRDRLTP